MHAATFAFETAHSSSAPSYLQLAGKNVGESDMRSVGLVWSPVPCMLWLHWILGVVSETIQHHYQWCWIFLSENLREYLIFNFFLYFIHKTWPGQNTVLEQPLFTAHMHCCSFIYCMAINVAMGMPCRTNAHPFQSSTFFAEGFYRAIWQFVVRVTNSVHSFVLL